MISPNTLEALTKEFCKIAEEKSVVERGKELASRAKNFVTDKENLRKAAPYAAGGAAAIGTYALMRKFKGHKNPALNALQKEMKGKDLMYQVDRTSKLDRLLFGKKTTSMSDPVKKGKGILNTSSNADTAKADVMINTDFATELNDKLKFDRIMGVKPNVTAKDTSILQNALKRVGGDISKLDQLYPNGFVVKPRTGSMGKVEDLITSVNDPKLTGMSKAKRTQHIIQEKLPIAEEFRVHTIDGVPFTASQRRIKNNTIRKVWNRISGSDGGGAFVPATGKTRKDMMKFVEENHNHLTDTFKSGNHTHVAYDVAKLKDGTFRLIEANPSPGTMRNPVVARKLNRMVTGKWDKDISAAAGLGVGTSVGLGAKKIKDKYTKNKA